MKFLALFSLVYPVAVLAVPGDPCSKGYGADCICLSTETCDQYKGTAIKGTKGNFPCPKDPDDIIGCVIKPCKNRSGNTQCLWKSACNDVMPVAACPGGKDFVCCNHQLEPSGHSSGTSHTSTATTSEETDTSTSPPTTATSETHKSTETSASETTTSGTAETSAATTSITSAPTTTPSTAAAATNGLAASELFGGLVAVFAALL